MRGWFLGGGIMRFPEKGNILPVRKHVVLGSCPEAAKWAITSNRASFTSKHLWQVTHPQDKHKNRENVLCYCRIDGSDVSEIMKRPKFLLPCMFNAAHFWVAVKGLKLSYHNGYI